jgi:tetratricopeptide (TPR) repeat protein
LVDAANASLQLISNFRNEKVMNLQRPFGGTETRGEPIRLFRESESELIIWMKQNKLPNEWCVILVRDEVTKHHLESVLDEGSKEFVETIAKFKGLEERNILLWDPTSGSDRILDLLYHPNRGKEAKARPWNLTTAVIELKYLFVALTRARYLLGIFLPNTTMKKGSINSLGQHFYSSEFVEKECYNESDIQGLGDFAEADFDEAQQMERGYEFANARQYKMAAATFRNANRIDLYHHYLGLYNADEGEYCDAIMAWSNTLEGASTDHNMRDETKKLMARHASSALEDETNGEGSNEIEIAIKIHAADLLGEKATSHLNAKLEERRKNYVAAAELFLKADLVQDFKRCLSKVQGQDKRARLLCLNGQYKEAEKLFRLHLRSNNPPIAIGIALEPDRFKEKVFTGALLGIYDRFEPGDISWAK